MAPSNAPFDAYYKWLAIPVEEQPPNHYRLLAVPLFTDDADVIANAADQRMGHIRSFQSGQHSALSQKLLNEIAQARICLLNSGTKSVYDGKLREQLAARKTAATPPEPALKPAIPIAGGDGPSSYSARRQHSRSEKKSQAKAVQVIAGSIAGLALGYLLLSWFTPLADVLGLFSKSSTRPGVAGNEKTKTPKPPQASSTASTTSAQRNKLQPKREPMDEPPAKETPSDSLPSSQPDSEPRSTESPASDKTNRLRQLHADRESAIERNDVEMTWRAIDAIVALDGGNAANMKVAILQQMKESIALDLYVERLLQLVEQAVADDHKDFADEHIAELVRAARKSDNHSFVRRATLCVLKVQTMKAP